MTNSQIADLAAAKLTGQITQTQITDSSISTSKLAATAVTTEKLAATAVTADKIAANAVTAEKIAAAVVTAEKIAANAITTDKLDANAVTAAKIAAAAITAAAIGANEIIANTANIADGIITSAKIASLLADKIDAGTLNAMVLQAAKTASNSTVFNSGHGVGSTFPAFCARRGYNGSGHDIDGSEYISLLTAYGWASGSGFATDRFGKSTMVFQVNIKGSFSITDLGAGLSHADIRAVFRINGGSWQPATEAARATTGNGGASVGDVIEVSGLAGGDVVEFGAEVVTPAPQAFGSVVLSVAWGNL
jgi:hypothetical protein